MLSKVFETNKHHLYLVGGTVRDYLSAINLTDMDAVTDATPEEMKSFLPDEVKADYTFMQYGSIKVTFMDVKFDITTLRKEKSYSDSRHPNSIKFVKSLRVDSKRRDFTLNAMYLNYLLEVKDFHHGRRDLEKRTLKMVGNPDKRIKEDPLRIFRAIRFALTYNYKIDDKLKSAILDNVNLIEKLNKEKIKQEIRKIKNADEERVKEFFNIYNINVDEFMIK